MFYVYVPFLNSLCLFLQYELLAKKCFSNSNPLKFTSNPSVSLYRTKLRYRHKHCRQNGEDENITRRTTTPYLLWGYIEFSNDWTVPSCVIFRGITFTRLWPCGSPERVFLLSVDVLPGDLPAEARFSLRTLTGEASSEIFCSLYFSRRYYQGVFKLNAYGMSERE